MLIAFEGIDGSGKATQAEMLRGAMHLSQRAATLMSFPMYDSTMFGPHIKTYLRGGFGPIDQNDPFLVSLLYGLDRFEALPLIRRHQNENRHIIFDRYVPSNIAHQCSKRAKLAPDNWKELASQIERVEYDLLKLPRPDLVFYLDLTAEQSYRITHERDDEKDIHQDDIDYLWWVREVYLEYASSHDNWHVIQCFDEQGRRSVEDIHKQIWTIFTTQE